MPVLRLMVTITWNWREREIQLNIEKFCKKYLTKKLFQNSSFPIIFLPHHGVFFVIHNQKG